MKFNSQYSQMRTHEAENYLDNARNTLRNVLVGDDISFRLFYLDVDLVKRSFKLSISYDHADDIIYSYDEKGKRYSRNETVELLKRYHKAIPSHVLEARKNQLLKSLRSNHLELVE